MSAKFSILFLPIKILKSLNINVPRVCEEPRFHCIPVASFFFFQNHVLKSLADEGLRALYTVASYILFSKG